MTQNYKLNGEDYIKYESTDLDFINEMRNNWENKNKRVIFIMEYEVSRDYAEHLEEIVAHINKALPSDEYLKHHISDTDRDAGYKEGLQRMKNDIQSILDGKELSK